MGHLILQYTCLLSRAVAPSPQLCHLLGPGSDPWTQGLTGHVLAHYPPFAHQRPLPCQAHSSLASPVYRHAWPRSYACIPHCLQPLVTSWRARRPSSTILAALLDGIMLANGRAAAAFAFASLAIMLADGRSMRVGASRC